ncbi:MAG: transporter [Candidatus Nealsonbacteria bacterium]|nr:transporter [Candidatus Nealsonbacteria bacterium]
MNLKLISLIFVAVLSLVGVIGDFFINLAGEGKKFIELKWFVIGFIIYASTAFGWFFLMKNIKLSTLGVFYAVSTMIFLTIISVFYFKEPINNYEILGIVTAVIALVLMGKFT